MDSTTHTQMGGLVLRASAPGAHQNMRRSYYTNDGSNDPPKSPGAKWKHEVLAYEDVKKDSDRFPYLPHPYPVKRKGRAHGGHPGGFTSLQEPMQTPKFPDEDQVYCTYSEWWQAQRPGVGATQEKDATFSSSYWPYGRRISVVASMDNADQYYNLDQRVVKNHAYYKTRRDGTGVAAMPFTRSRSSAELHGSQAEHLGYNRSMGQTVSSHASASFHETNRFNASNPGAKASTGRNMWDSKKAQVPEPTALQRCTSAPSTSRSSFEAQAGSSRYDPKQGLRTLGLGQRTMAEWCLPAAPAYPKDSMS